MRSVLCIALAALAPAVATAAATSAVLPAWACTHADAVYADAFDASQPIVPHDPSGGAGGAYPGKLTRTLHIAGLGSGMQDYYVYIPTSYTPGRPTPLMLALHGAAPYGSAGSYAATIRDNWSGVAEAGEFIVAAPVADAVYYQNGGPYAVSWLIPPTNGPSDYDLFDAVRADLESAYNIERSRIYGWGFSSGGHVMHDLVINHYSEAFNVDTMAGYAVGGADLAALACAGDSSAACGARLAALPRKIPVDIHIGTSDPNFSYAQEDHTLFLAEGWVNRVTIDYNKFVGGHQYTVDQLGDVWDTLCPAALVH